MLGISLFKQSRYFIATFLLITVIPLVSLQLWSQYASEQNLFNRQKLFLEMDISRIHQAFLQQLEMSRSEIEETANSLHHQDLTLAEYKGIFNAQSAWWINSKEAGYFMQQHPEIRMALNPVTKQVVGDYFPSREAIQSYFIVPLANSHQGLLLIKTTPAEAFAPNGPYKVTIYAGAQPDPSSIIFKSDFMWHRYSFSPVFLLNHRFSSHKAKAQELGPPSAGPPPPPDLACPKPNCFDPKLSKVVTQKTLQLSNLSGKPVVTIAITVLTPPHPSSNDTRKNNQWISLLIIITGVMSSLLAGQYLRTNFIAPLMQLAQVATKVQRGDLSSRIDTEGIKQAEVRQTLEKFNDMLNDLMEKEQLRNSFISNLTHDFRTPLVAQRRSLELLSQEMRQLQLNQQEKLSRGLLKNSEHLLAMVNQLLETYQTETGSFTLKLNQEFLPTLVNQCFDQLASLSEERQITLTQQFPEDFPQLMVDSYYLKRVFINLIGNGIENIPKKSRIDITGKCLNPDRVEIHVRDNGLGIPQQEQKHLFERYYAGTGDTRKLGSGLGLYICAVLIAAHQGTITVDSVEGQYTDFIITLPVMPQRGIA